MSFSGGFDLSGLANQAPAADQQAGAAGAGHVYVIDVDESNLQDTLQSSTTHIVVLNLWSARAQGATEFNEALARVTDTLHGQILLANVDLDAHPAIGQAFQVQTVPLVLGVVNGRPVPLFQSTVAEDDIRRTFDELVTVAVQNGVTGRTRPVGTAPHGGENEEQAGPDPRFAEADAALDRADFDGAVAAYETLLANNPADDEAAERLAGVKLLQRVDGADLNAARQAAADAPDDIDAQLLVADLDVSGGHVEDAFVRLIDLVKAHGGDDRERVRERLVELFTVVGSADPRVATARRALAAALF